MDKIPRLALVLFDIDGCTAIVATSKLRSSRKPVIPGLQCILNHNRTDYKIEVLQLSDSKPALNRFEKEWATLERAKALDKEKEERGHAENGYLMVQTEEDDFVPPSPTEQNRTEPTEQRRPEPTEQRRPEPTEQRRRELTEQCRPEGTEPEQSEFAPYQIMGSNNRSVSVLYQGSGQSDANYARPQRQPVYLTDLGEDERDCVVAQVSDYEKSRRSFGTQTEEVLIFKNKEELLESYDPKGRSLSDLFTMINSNSGKLSEIVDVVNGLKNGVLNEILGLVRGLKEDRDVSKIIHMGLLSDLDTSADSAKESEEQSVEDVTNSKTDTDRNENDDSNVFDAYMYTYEHLQFNENQKEGDESTSKNQKHDHNSAGKLQKPSAVSAGKKQKLDDVSDENQLPGEIGKKKQLVPRTSPLRAEGFSHLLQCNCGPIVEISCHEDMEKVDPNAEVRIAPFVQRQFQTAAGWPGSFAWQMAQRIYKPEELVGRNYYGKLQKPSLSPRRRHALEHAVLENLGDDSLALRKAVEGINTGIRNKAHKQKVKANKPPIPRPLFPIDNNKL